MNRFGALVWLLLVVLAGFATFKAKYAVQDLEDQLRQARKETIAEQQELRVLNAEWTYLNQPERLADLNRRFLSLVPITTKQLERRIVDIPMRATPAPETLVAAAAKPMTTQAPPPPPPRPAAAARQTPSSRPLVVAATFTPAGTPAGIPAGTPAEPLRLAKVGYRSVGTLDALIAQIAEAQ